MSSYMNTDISYVDILSLLVYMKTPKKIVEFGILNGHSLQQFIDSTDCTTTSIQAFDIFDDFNGNCASENTISEKFGRYANVNISKCNFYDIPQDLKDIDLLHVDIANDASTYQFCIENYLDKVSNDGIIVLEGGSVKRDQVDWMLKYNKTPINPYIESLSSRLDISVKVYGEFPSITVIKKKFKFRRICETDLEQVYELLNNFTRYVDDSKRFDLFTTQFETHSEIYVIELNNEIIATGKIIFDRKIHNNFKYVAYIEDVIVSPDYRNHGVGNYLISSLKTATLSRDCYKIVLNCSDSLLGFYNKHGFKNTGSAMTIYNNSP